jgi:hypothetical protein
MVEGFIFFNAPLAGSSLAAAVSFSIAVLLKSFVAMAG